MSTLPARILVVDDDPDTREVMLRLLRSQGYQVRATGTCQGAIRCLDAEPVDLLVADYLLPDGDALTILIHARKLYPIEGILISGISETDHAESGMVAGIAADHFAVRMTKPITFARLEQAIEELLEPRRRAALTGAGVEAARSAVRVRTLREKVTAMTKEELDGLARALRRHGDDLKEEMQVLNQAIRDRRLSQGSPGSQGN